MASRKPKRGLVLGAGGVLGAAWSVGALCALEEVIGFDPREAEVIIGTSAGSVLASLVGGGVSPRQLRDHQLGVPITEGPLAGFSWDYERATTKRPGVPRLFGPGSGSSCAPALVGCDRCRRLLCFRGFLPARAGFVSADRPSC